MIDPRVLEAMDPWLREEYGNPASRSHQHGWRAEEAVETARTQVASLVGACHSEIIFTSGATESNNMVLKGLDSGIITTSIEHKSIIVPCTWLGAKSKRRISVVEPDVNGVIDPREIADFIMSADDLVSIMLANNEVGTIQPVADVVRHIQHKYGSGFIHSDMAQALGKIPVNLEALGVHFASFSSHKMYGPKGIGALYIRDDVSRLLTPLLHGGGQERGIRSGTLNVPAIVGFGKACAIAKDEICLETVRISSLRDIFEQRLSSAICGVGFHGGKNRLPGTSSFYLPCKDMNAFMAFISDNVSLSLGSACMSNSGKSHVLSAMGIDDDTALRTVRVCVGRFNTEDEIVRAVEAIEHALDKANNGG